MEAIRKGYLFFLKRYILFKPLPPPFQISPLLLITPPPTPLFHGTVKEMKDTNKGTEIK